MRDEPDYRFTGWEPDAPASDTILRAFLLNWAEFGESTVGAMGGPTLRRGDLVACDLGRPAAYSNCATLLRPLGADNLAETVATLAEFFGLSKPDGRNGEVVIFSAWPTPDLRPHGWTLMGHPAFHLLPPGCPEPPCPPGLRIERVADEAALAEWERAAVVGFELPELEPSLPGGLYDGRVLADARLRFWTGRDDTGRVVAVSSAFTAHGLNDVLFVATLPEARRKGYGEAMTWKAALAEPGLPAVLLSSDPGRPVYDRMGFFPLLRFTLWYRSR